jgi:hypothetical protein
MKIDQSNSDVDNRGAEQNSEGVGKFQPVHWLVLQHLCVQYIGIWQFPTWPVLQCIINWYLSVISDAKFKDIAYYVYLHLISFGLKILIFFLFYCAFYISSPVPVKADNSVIVESWLRPCWPSDQLGCTSPLLTVNPVGGVLHHPCTVPVYKLLLIRQ